MWSPPMKPHFFTFVCSDPSSRNGSVIPKSFVHKYLKVVMRFDSAVLKRGNWSWKVELADVKIKGETARVFSNGWEKVEKENGFKTGDFIVFRHEGYMVFEILVFDPSFCEREFPIDTIMEGKKSLPKGTSSKQPSTNVINLEGSEEMQVNEEEDAMSSEAEDDHPSFSSTLKAYSTMKSSLRIPLEFSKSIGLTNKRCVVILDEKQRSWPVKLRHDTGYVCFGKGWTIFRMTNGLKEGDKFVIELTKNGKKPILNFRLVNQNNKLVKTPASSKQTTRDSSEPRNRAEKRSLPKRKVHVLDLEAQTKEKELKGYSKTGAKDHFVGILKRYCFDLPNLYFPREFARSNGLTNGQMILENKNGKMWLVELKLRDTGSVYISRGWKEFRIENSLKEGDAFKLELMENARAKFSCL